MSPISAACSSCCPEGQEYPERKCLETRHSDFESPPVRCLGPVQGSGVGQECLEGRTLSPMHPLVPHQQICPQHLRCAQSWDLAKELSGQVTRISHTRPELSGVVRGWRDAGTGGLGGGRGFSQRRVLWLLEDQNPLHRGIQLRHHSLSRQQQVGPDQGCEKSLGTQFW